MFNPSNFDEVCSSIDFRSTKEVPPTERKRNGKEKNATTVKKEEEKPTCSHCQKKRHEEAKCWKLHLEFKPKWFKD